MPHGLAALKIPSEAPQSIFVVVGAIVIGATAWLQLADAPFDGGASGADRDAERRHGLTSIRCEAAPRLSQDLHRTELCRGLAQ